MTLTRDVCQRRPWGLDRLLRRHAGETGVAVYGWFPRVRVYGPVAWASVAVTVDGRPAGLVHQTADRLLWVPVEPGTHDVLVGAPVAPESRTYRVDLWEGDIVCLAFVTPRWNPSRKYRTPIWCPPRLVSGAPDRWGSRADGAEE